MEHLIIPDLDPILKRYPDPSREHLIPLLQDVQEEQGYLSKESIGVISQHLHVAPAKIYGVATFYNQFRFTPLGQFHIMVCRGTACHVKGSANVLAALCQDLKIQPGQTTRDGQFSLEVVACIGACGLAPLISINGEYHAGVTPAKIKKILNTYRNREEIHANG